jgi:hypothetical protein
LQLEYISYDFTKQPQILAIHPVFSRDHSDLVVLSGSDSQAMSEGLTDAAQACVDGADVDAFCDAKQRILKSYYESGRRATVAVDTDRQQLASGVSMAMQREIPWVVVDGRPGELGHCTRCGDALQINLPQPLPVVAAAMKAFSLMHRECQPVTADSGQKS